MATNLTSDPFEALTPEAQAEIQRAFAEIKEPCVTPPRSPRVAQPPGAPGRRRLGVLPLPDDDEPATPCPRLDFGGGAPLTRCGPRGPDPYVADREAAQTAAQVGQLTPTNQHGCMYFSASEWVFCPMCEWMKGRYEGELSGALQKLGVSNNTVTEERVAGLEINITQPVLQAFLKRCRAFLEPLSDPEWLSYGGTVGGTVSFTRSQLHNLLAVHGCPSGILTDDVWAEAKALSV